MKFENLKLRWLACQPKPKAVNDNGEPSGSPGNLGVLYRNNLIRPLGKKIVRLRADALRRTAFLTFVQSFYRISYSACGWPASRSRSRRLVGPVGLGCYGRSSFGLSRPAQPPRPPDARLWLAFLPFMAAAASFQVLQGLEMIMASHPARLKVLWWAL